MMNTHKLQNMCVKGPLRLHPTFKIVSHQGNENYHFGVILVPLLEIFVICMHTIYAAQLWIYSAAYTWPNIVGGGEVASPLFRKDDIKYLYCFRTKDYCLPKYWGATTLSPSSGYTL